jgi:hypothetical protein
VENIHVEEASIPEISMEKIPVVNGNSNQGIQGEELKVDIVDVPENDDTAPAPEKKPRRKRGQRGGKNNKKKVGFVEATTDVDDEEQGEGGDGNGYIHVSLPKEVPKDIPVNDQGNHAIDGLVVTDKLLGISLLNVLTNRQRKSGHICLRRDLGRHQSRRQTHANRKL